jgi:hypothetical protein
LRFDNQIEIEGAEEDGFRDGGDSGSLIVDEGRRAVALLFAGSDIGGTNGKGLTYANPIRAVLDALGVETARRTFVSVPSRTRFHQPSICPDSANNSAPIAEPALWRSLFRRRSFVRFRLCPNPQSYKPEQ